MNTWAVAYMNTWNSTDILLLLASFFILPCNNNGNIEKNKDNLDANTMIALILIFTKAAWIKPLHGRDNLIEWDKKLQKQLRIFDFYVILINFSHKSDETAYLKEYQKWTEYQQYFKGLFFCIISSHPKSLLMKDLKLILV